MGSCFSGPVPPSRRRHHSRSPKEPRRAPVAYEYYYTVQNNEQVLIRRRAGQPHGHDRGSFSRAVDGPSTRSGRHGGGERYGLVLREESTRKKPHGKRSKGKGKSKSRSSRDKKQQKSHRSQHSRRHSSHGSDGGDEGRDEDAQNQIGFWLDETRDGNDQGGVGGHDDVSSLHEDDEEQDAQRSPELVRR